MRGRCEHCFGVRRTLIRIKADDQIKFTADYDQHHLLIRKGSVATIKAIANGIVSMDITGGIWIDSSKSMDFYPEFDDVKLPYDDDLLRVIKVIDPNETHLL